MGGTTISNTAQKLGTVRIQSSAYGLTIPIGYGRNRMPGNLMFQAGFKATPRTTTTSSGGKGGSVTQKDTTFTYTADAMMGITQGPCGPIQSMWKTKDRITGVAFTAPQTCVENLTVPFSLKVRLSFFAFYTSLTTVVLCQDATTTTNTTLALGVDYTVAAGIITMLNSAHAGKVVRVTYVWTPSGDMVSAVSKVGMTLFNGSWGQATWSHLTTKYPSQAIPYNNIAYVAAAAYLLNDDASFANHNFEMNFKLQYPGKADANPADCAVDMLTNPDSGAQFPGQKLFNVETYSDYCRAAGLFLSPVYIEQAEARSHITELMKMTNSAAVWSEGKLKFVPYGDATLTANGVTYTPNLTPIYDLTDDDFLSDRGADPVRCDRKTSADAFNVVQIEFLNRANAYNVEIVERKDQANIEQYGLRIKDPIQMHAVCDATVAATIAQLLLQRELYVRNVYTFSLGWKYALLEPMDIVTLTDPGLNLNLTPVRIVSVDEDDNGKLTLTAEDFPAGVASATLYPSQATSGYQNAFNALPGNVLAPVFMESPIDLTIIDNEVWMAISGADPNWGGCTIWYSLDGIAYKRFDRHFGSRYGTLTSSLSAGGSVIAAVSLTGQGGQMLSGTNAEADANATLCWCEGEYFTYTTAALTGTNAYNLTTRNRGVYGTNDSAHASASRFVRVDQAVARVGPFDLKLTGQTFYFKFTSFNVYGNEEQELADVSAYTYTVTRDVSTDNILTPPEKPTVKLDYEVILAEQPGLDAQATALSLVDEQFEYDAAVAFLTAYLATLTTPVAWNNLNGNTILP